MNLPIRARLTLWYVGVLALTLLLFAAGVLAFVRREQRIARAGSAGSWATKGAGMLSAARHWAPRAGRPMAEVPPPR